MELAHQLIEFFINPYAQSSWPEILLEIFATTMGITSVLCAKRGSIWVYPTGIISTLIYIYICLKVGYYGDTIINIYYTLMSVYGWVLWTKKSKDSTTLTITFSSKKDYIATILITVFSMIFVTSIYLWYHKFESWLNYIDVLTTGLAFGSMWLMAKKKVENWIGWIITDFISVPLYFAKGLGFTGIQFTIFLILAYQGYIIWKKDAHRGEKNKIHSP